MKTRQHIKRMLIAFCALFVVLCVYLVYIVNAYGTRWFNSPYNTRVSAQKSSVIPGSILDRNGVTLAATNSEGNRVYSDDRSLRRAVSHTVGDSYGQTYGAEMFFSKYLLGFDQSIVERVSQALQGVRRYGSDVALTIDAKLCDYAYHRIDGYQGALVVMNYQTGELLCSVSNPIFDPKYIDDYLNGDESLAEGAMVNRVTSGRYTPGSVFKIVTAVTALRYLPGVTERTFLCDGPLAFDKNTGKYLEKIHISPAQDEKNQADDTAEDAENDETPGVSGAYNVLRDYNGEYHGEITFQKAFAKSCNHVFAQLAMEVGAERLARVAKELGIGDDFLFGDMMAYASSYQKPENDWELAWSGVGQYKDIITPLNMCMIVAGVANGGDIPEPKLLLSVKNRTGITLSMLHRSDYSNNALSASEAETLTKLMLGAVDGGTGTRAKVSGYAVAGKTGTAETGSGVKPNAWFAGFIDDDAHPLAIVVVLEKGGSGGSVAAPIAGKVLQRAIELGY